MPLKIAIGQIVGQYQIDYLLGRGGMAIVYLARDLSTRQPVAIKFLNLDALPATAALEAARRFDLEARQLAALSHPNIIHILATGYHEDVPYLVMDYVAGGTLKDRMGSPIPWTESVRWVRPLADALALAHQRGIIHRDVKPSNILIAPDGIPVLSDFGIAKTFGDGTTTLGVTLTATGAVVGTPEYMAPEQARGTHFDQRIDIYALGIVLYELITGKRPFTADTPIEVLIKHMTEPLPLPRQLVRDLPRRAETVLLRALAKSPGDRYPTMAAFGQALDALLQPPRISGSSPWAWRGVALVALTGLGATVALGASLLWPSPLSLYTPTRPAPTLSPTIQRQVVVAPTWTVEPSAPEVRATPSEAPPSRTATVTSTPTATATLATIVTTITRRPTAAATMSVAAPTLAPTETVLEAPTSVPPIQSQPTAAPIPVDTLPPPVDTMPPPADTSVPAPTRPPTPTA